MKFFKGNWFNLFLIAAFCIFTLLSYQFNFQPGITIFSKNFRSFFIEMILLLPFMFILIGLADVWISKEKVIRHIGQGSGVRGTLYVVILSMAQAGPLYGAFPVAYLLWQKGASIRNVFMYLSAFCTIKIPMLTFEIGFLGWKFSLLRTLITLPFLYLISYGMERLLRNTGFSMNQG